MRVLEYYLWIAPHVFLGLLLSGLVRRRLQHRFPLFFAYVLFTLGHFLVLFTIVSLPKSSLRTHEWIMVCGLGISTFLRLGVVYELSSDLLSSHSVVVPTLRSLMRWITVLMLLVATAASAMQFRSGLAGVESAFHFLDLCWSVVLSGILLTLVVFTRAFRISWRSYAAGIALGFGVFAAAELGTSAFRPQLGTQGNVTISLIQMSGHHLCVLVWLFYLLLPERVPQYTGTGLQRADLELWDQELQRMVQR